MTRRWWFWVAIVAVVGVVVYFLIQGFLWQARAKDAIARAEASGRRLDSIAGELDQERAVTDSLRRLARRRDTVIHVRIQRFRDSLPGIIAQVDSMACAPVITALRTCDQLVDSVTQVAADWRGVAERDSAQVLKERSLAVQERARGDSLLNVLRQPRGRWLFGLPKPKCIKGAGGGYDPINNQPAAVIGYFCGF